MVKAVNCHKKVYLLWMGDSPEISNFIFSEKMIMKKIKMLSAKVVIGELRITG